MLRGTQASRSMTVLRIADQSANSGGVRERWRYRVEKQLQGKSEGVTKKTVQVCFSFLCQTNTEID